MRIAPWPCELPIERIAIASSSTPFKVPQSVPPALPASSVGFTVVGVSTLAMTFERNLPANPDLSAMLV